MTEAGIEYVLSILRDAQEKSTNSSLAALPNQYPVLTDTHKIELMRRVRGKLRERLKYLQLQAGIPPDLATGEPPKTYERGRICPKNHNVADSDRFCEVCGLLPSEGPWGDYHPELNGASSDLKSIVYESARMADEITRLENEAPGQETSQNVIAATNEESHQCPNGHPAVPGDSFCQTCGSMLARSVTDSPAGIVTNVEPSAMDCPPAHEEAGSGIQTTPPIPYMVELQPPAPGQPVIPGPDFQATGTSEVVSFDGKNLTFTNIANGQGKVLPPRYITSIDFHPASSGEGFIHFHRLIDDRDLARAVPSAFSSLPTDWSKVDVFRANFGPDQEPQFAALKDAVAQAIAPAKQDGELERLLALLKAKGIISDAEIG